MNLIWIDDPGFTKADFPERRCCACGQPIPDPANVFHSGKLHISPALDLNPKGSQERTHSLIGMCCFWLLPDAIINKHKKHMLGV